jgi:hypothetical protein
MSESAKIGRREACAAVLGAGGSLLLAGGGQAADACCAQAIVPLKNSDFYDAEGKFLADKARDAYYAMFERFGYPNPEPQKKGMWVQDFGLGDFVNVGMAGIFWFNDKQYKYFGHEIYLLPGQQIPEHKHVETAESAAKMEAWHVRHGMIYCFGEGDETLPVPCKLPESQEKIRTVKHAHQVLPGEVYSLNRPEAFHFMIAGPEGAIVSEYANYHDGDALRFANPNVKF